MMNPLLAAELGRMEYEERLRKAQEALRFKRLNHRQPVQARIAKALGDFLVASGRKLQDHYQPAGA
ncbi:MAG TPA: hypothetical protein G4O02_03375 [Caldilineae bacterium]|nr:hypothetical protein [Caldilineae bacterium]